MIMPIAETVSRALVDTHNECAGALLAEPEGTVDLFLPSLRRKSKRPWRARRGPGFILASNALY
jgi:hypothetical protein